MNRPKAFTIVSDGNTGGMFETVIAQGAQFEDGSAAIFWGYKLEIVPRLEDYKIPHGYGMRRIRWNADSEG